MSWFTASSRISAPRKCPYPFRTQPRLLPPYVGGFLPLRVLQGGCRQSGHPRLRLCNYAASDTRGCCGQSCFPLQTARPQTRHTHFGSPSVQGSLDSSTERPDIPLGLNQPPPGVESWVRCVLYPAKKTKLLPKRPLASQNSTIEDSSIPFGDINFQKLDSRAAFGHTEVEIAGFRLQLLLHREEFEFFLCTLFIALKDNIYRLLPCRVCCDHDSIRGSC